MNENLKEGIGLNNFYTIQSIFTGQCVRTVTAGQEVVA